MNILGVTIIGASQPIGSKICAMRDNVILLVNLAGNSEDKMLKEKQSSLACQCSPSTAINDEFKNSKSGSHGEKSNVVAAMVGTASSAPQTNAASALVPEHPLALETREALLNALYTY